MNIALLIPELGGGGAERVAQILGNYYVEKGNKVYYFIADTNVEQDYFVKGEIIQSGIKRCMYGRKNNVQKIVNLLSSALKMKKLKVRYKIDVAISFMEEFNYINILSKGREKVITRICTMLSVCEELYPENILFRKSVIHFFYTKADKVVVLSQKAEEEMQFYYKVPKKILMKIPNMVTYIGTQKNKTSDWTYGKKTVVCVGRLAVEKQYERIIRAFSYVCSKEPEARLIILGKGSLLYYLRRMCKKYHIDDYVVFTGFIDDVSLYLENARVFVMASRVEGFPNSMIEAMGYGVPIVTTDSFGACGEIVGKTREMKNVSELTLCEYGVLTPDMPHEGLKIDSQLSEQETILGKAILKILTEEDIYEKYRKQSFRRAKMFYIGKIIKKWNKVCNYEYGGQK